MRYIPGGRTTPRSEIENDFLPAFLSYYDRFDGYGFWAAIEKETQEFVGWFHLRVPRGARPTTSRNSDTGYDAAFGDAGSRQRARGRSSRSPSRDWAPSGSWRRPWR